MKMKTKMASAFKLLWEELVRGGMGPNQAAAEALKRFKTQTTTVADTSNFVPNNTSNSTQQPPSQAKREREESSHKSADSSQDNSKRPRNAQSPSLSSSLTSAPARSSSSTSTISKYIYNMKRDHSTRDSTSAPNDSKDDEKRLKTKDYGIDAAYSLKFADGNILFDPTTSAKCSLLANLDPCDPVPITQFHVATAHALLTVLALNNMSYASHLTPEIYVNILHLCDYLGMGEDITTRLLLLLEPAAPEDPLSRLRACHLRLPIFSRILYQRCDSMFESEEQAAQVTTRLLSSPEKLTYLELSVCDGIFSAKKKKHLHLYRFAATERDRRQAVKDAAVVKTKALRKNLVDRKTVGDNVAILEEAFVNAIFCDDRTISYSINSSFILSKELLDANMWKAINEGRLDAAQRLLDLGAEPAMTLEPAPGSNVSIREIHSRKDSWNQIHICIPDFEPCGSDMYEFPSSLMLAVINDDLNMVRWLTDVAGVPANFKQAVLVCCDDADVENGGMNALWVTKSVEVMQHLLSRGCNPKQYCLTETNEGRAGTRKQPLLHGDGQGSCTVNNYDRMLITHGANPNVFLTSCEHDEAHASACDWAYWPNILNSYNVDMEWCKQLLEIYDANPNWPHNVENNDHGEVPCGPTVLLQAVMNNNLKVVKMLLEHRADPNMYEIPGWVEEGQEILYFLPPSSKHSCGLFNTAVDMPQPYGNGNHKNRTLQCPLSAALKVGNKEMIKLLKKHGAMVDSAMDIDTYIVLNPKHPMINNGNFNNTYLTADAPDTFKNNKSCVMVSVSQNSHSFEYASDVLKADKDVIISILYNHPQDNSLYWMRHIPLNIKSDKEFMLSAVKLNGNALQHASSDLKNDREVVVAAVNQNSQAIHSASEELKSDKEFMMAVKLDH